METLIATYEAAPNRIETVKNGNLNLTEQEYRELCTCPGGTRATINNSPLFAIGREFFN